MNRAIDFPQSLVTGFDSEQIKSIQKLLFWYTTEYVDPVASDLTDLGDRVTDLENAP